MSSIHQIIHSGKEFPMTYQKRKQHTDDYYFYKNSYSQGIRKWNRNPNQSFRKFMVHQGSYVTKPNATVEVEALLNFWATYEADTEFELLQQNNKGDYWEQPLAIHKTLPVKKSTGTQSTNPYIFGERFYYIKPSLAGLPNFEPGDLVLLGSEFGAKGNVQFHLDTLLVIHDTMKINGSEFSDNYRQVTLKPLKT